MIKLITYLFPILVNYVCGGVFFITPLRCSQAHTPGWVVGATLSTWALVYSLVTYFIGRRVTPKNAVPLIAAAGVMITLASAGFLLFTGVYTQFVWIALVGAAAATYCTSFQVFIKSIEQNANTGVVRATALYTASWSIGIATGPLIFGLLAANTSFIINAVLGLLITAGILFVAWKYKNMPAEPAQEKAGTASEQSPAPAKIKGDFVRVGWCIGGVGTIAIFVLRSLVPYRTTILEFSKADSSFILASVSVVQSLTALALIRSRTMMYKISPVILAVSSGIIALLLFGFSNSVPLFLTAGILFGLYSGYFYFMFVYHSLISPDKSTKYVAVNEIIVGATGTIGPFVGGLLTSPETSGAAFLAAAVLCAASIVYAVFYFKTNKTA